MLHITSVARLVIGTKHDVNVTSRAAGRILQTDFGKRRPGRIGWEKEIRSSVGNHPGLPKTDWAGDHDFVFVEHTAHAERVLCLVFCAVRNFVVEWAKPFIPVPVRGGAGVPCWESEDFSQWMFRRWLVGHAKESLGSMFGFFEEISFVSEFKHQLGSPSEGRGRPAA